MGIKQCRFLVPGITLRGKRGPFPGRGKTYVSDTDPKSGKPNKPYLISITQKTFQIGRAEILALNNTPDPELANSPDLSFPILYQVAEHWSLLWSPSLPLLLKPGSNEQCVVWDSQLNLNLSGKARKSSILHPRALNSCLLIRSPLKSHQLPTPKPSPFLEQFSMTCWDS